MKELKVGMYVRIFGDFDRYECLKILCEEILSKIEGE